MPRVSCYAKCALALAAVGLAFLAGCGKAPKQQAEWHFKKASEAALMSPPWINFDKAKAAELRHLRVACELDPSNPDYRYAYYLALPEGAPKDAEAEGLAKSGGRYRAAVLARRASTSFGLAQTPADFAAVRDSLEQAVAADPDDGLLDYTIASVHVRSGDREAAYEAISSGVAKARWDTYAKPYAGEIVRQRPFTSLWMPDSSPFTILAEKERPYHAVHAMLLLREKRLQLLKDRLVPRSGTPRIEGSDSVVQDLLDERHADQALVVCLTMRRFGARWARMSPGPELTRAWIGTRVLYRACETAANILLGAGRDRDLNELKAEIASLHHQVSQLREGYGTGVHGWSTWFGARPSSGERVSARKMWVAWLALPLGIVLPLLCALCFLMVNARRSRKRLGSRAGLITLLACVAVTALMAALVGPLYRGWNPYLTSIESRYLARTTAYAEDIADLLDQAAE